MQKHRPHFCARPQVHKFSQRGDTWQRDFNQMMHTQHAVYINETDKELIDAQFMYRETEEHDEEVHRILEEAHRPVLLSDINEF